MLAAASEAGRLPARLLHGVLDGGERPERVLHAARTWAPTFGDLFADVLRPRPAEPSPGGERGADLHVSVRLSFDEAMRGGTRPSKRTSAPPASA